MINNYDWHAMQDATPPATGYYIARYDDGSTARNLWIKSTYHTGWSSNTPEPDKITAWAPEPEPGELLDALQYIIRSNLHR